EPPTSRLSSARSNQLSYQPLSILYHSGSRHAKNQNRADSRKAPFLHVPRKAQATTNERHP
ncbi:MAG: hypothetical protein LBD66_01040, partial [Holosporales bacterium]|nr:hypothetical protein [Holosporales bacterium]